MNLETPYKNSSYPFEVTLYHDECTDEHRFLIVSSATKRYFLAEKTVPSGKWDFKGGQTFAGELITVVYNAIDEASAKQLFEERRPLFELEARVNQLYWGA